MELVGLTVAVVSQDLDVVEHRLDDLLVDPLKFALDLEKLPRLGKSNIFVIRSKTFQLFT